MANRKIAGSGQALGATLLSDSACQMDLKDIELAKRMQNSFKSAGAFGFMTALVGPTLVEQLDQREGMFPKFTKGIIKSLMALPGMPEPMDAAAFGSEEGKIFRVEMAAELNQAIDEISTAYKELQNDLGNIFREEFPLLCK